MFVTLDSKRRLTVPASLAPASPGEHFDARFDAEEDAIVFRQLPEEGKEDWLAVLKLCPVSMDDKSFQRTPNVRIVLSAIQGMNRSRLRSEGRSRE